MKGFLKRWLSEFKKEQNKRQKTLLPTMSIEEFSNIAYELDKKETKGFIKRFSQACSDTITECHENEYYNKRN